eukprot:gene13234-9080_t
MSLVAARNFSEYYNSLVNRTIPDDEKLKNIVRKERSARRIIADEEWDEFRDVLHITGVWITEKKEAAKGFLPPLNDRELAVFKRQREIWFPKQLPKVVPPPVRRVVHGYPFAKARAIIEEETRLRTWLAGVEQQLFNHIEQASADSLYMLTCFDDLNRREERGRARVEQEEYEVFATIRKSVFLKAPPGFFRQKVIERYGESKIDETRNMTLEEIEQMERKKLEKEEHKDFINVYNYINEIYKAYFFMINHQEICGRQELEKLEQETLYSIIAHSCRRSFGLRFYHTPAIVLHCSDHCKILSAMSAATLEDMKQKEQEIKAQFRGSA